jgi:hypothetical protein
MVGSGTNSGVPRIQHLASSSVQSPISPSTAELNMKIASVKKVQCFFFFAISLSFLLTLNVLLGLGYADRHGTPRGRSKPSSES